MWSVTVTDMLGRPVEIGWDSDKRHAFIGVELPEPHHCNGCPPVAGNPCPGIKTVRIPIAAEVFRSIARVISGWPL